MNHALGPARGTAPRPAARWPRSIVVVLVLVVMVLSGLLTTVLPLNAAASEAPIGVPVGSTGLQTGAQLQKAPFLTHPGTGLTALQNTTVLGPTPSSQLTQFTIGFAIQNQSLLQQILNEQQDVGSPYFHDWLSLAQERAMFAPDPIEVQNTINYFTSLGFNVETQGLLSVTFQGNAAAADRAFETSLVQADVNGSPASVNSMPLSLPSPIASAITTVNGLDTNSQFQIPLEVGPSSVYLDGAEAHTNPLAGTSVQDEPESSAATPFALSPIPAAPPGANLTNVTALYNFTNHAFGWFQLYNNYYHRDEPWQVISPASLSYLYDALPLLNQGYNGNSTGSPITIAIVMTGGINPDDMEEAAQMIWNNPHQIMDRLTAFPVDGSYGLNGTHYSTDGGSSEMALDIEYSSTMAPRAHIDAVYGPCLCYTVLDDDYATLANLHTAPNIVSNSWGGDEDGGYGLAGPSWDNILSIQDYIELLTARGSTVLASSGDGGGFDSSTGMLSGSFPATDPYVLAVNGIRTVADAPDGQAFPMVPSIGWENYSLGPLGFAPGWDSQNVEWRISTAASMDYQSYWYEPWINTTLYNEPPQGSGGLGISNWFNQSWWQHGPFMPDLGRSLGSGVSAEADYNESIFFDGIWNYGWGGTSFACPTTAGMFALVDDYLKAHGGSGYLGNGNIVTGLVGNAWYNGNLSLDPYFNVVNGTSYWGNKGVINDWSWPRGDLYPETAYGASYGNTSVGWNFPTGWGSLDVDHFAQDVLTLETLPGQFQTVTAGSSTWDPSVWGNLALNQTYTIHVNATAPLVGVAHVTVVFHPESGTPVSFQPTLTATTLGPGEYFTLNTSQFSSVGYVYFEFGDAANKTLGFDYDWVAPDIPSSGFLEVQVVDPSPSIPFPGGEVIYDSAWPNAWLSEWTGNVGDFPDSAFQPYPNTFSVLVTDNGRPVYNAVVTATIPSTNDIVYQGSEYADEFTHGNGYGHVTNTTTIDYSFTNTSGEALVNTVNVNTPVPITIHASYGPLTATTTYAETTLPNIQPVDSDNGNYSEWNLLHYVLTYHHEPYTPALEDLLEADSATESAYNSMIFAWQGEQLTVNVANSSGGVLPNLHVWLGQYDIGNATKFEAYEETGGVQGWANVSGTSNTTQSNGDATIYVPDNMTPASGIDFIAVNEPGLSNRSFSYTEPCFPPVQVLAEYYSGGSSYIPPYSCEYNASYERNYTAVPAYVLPDPVFAETQTRAGAVRDFFNTGTNISTHVEVQLPDVNPFFGGPGFIGWDWGTALEHVTSVEAYVDGNPAGDLSPGAGDYFQWYNITGNLTGSYAPGIHTLLIVVRDSTGHIFTYHETFIVGSISYETVPGNTVYPVLPFNLNWTVNIPANDMSNRTFNSSLEIQYVTSGCGGPTCPKVVNLTIRVHVGQTQFSQNINRSLLATDDFYGGAGDFPPGEYEFTVWLTANRSGSVEQAMEMSLVFDPLIVQIDGPTPNAVVPLGNLTISYSYDGLFISGAGLSVYAPNSLAPVFQSGAVVPGIGSRAGSATWTSVATGPYEIALNVTTPYQNVTTVEWVNVTSASNIVYFNGTAGQTPIAGFPVAITAVVIALIAAIVGILVGRALLVPGRRPDDEPVVVAAPVAAGTAAAAAPKRPDSTPGGDICPICHESFTTGHALQQHMALAHGIEE
jgi:subtilase family serine protease